jgi:hypothetical protein
LRGDVTQHLSELACGEFARSTGAGDHLGQTLGQCALFSALVRCFQTSLPSIADLSAVFGLLAVVTTRLCDVFRCPFMRTVWLVRYLGFLPVTSGFLSVVFSFLVVVSRRLSVVSRRLAVVFGFLCRCTGRVFHVFGDFWRYRSVSCS